MIACILATDMDAHALLQDELSRRGATTSNMAFDLSNATDKVTLFKCLLHAADISNPTRNFSTSSRLSLLAIQEFNQQALDEEKLGIPVTPFMVAKDFPSKCKGEIFFYSQVAMPYFVALKSCFPAQIRYDPVSAIEKNVECWKRQCAFNELTL